jgi:hypothetical protein
MKQKPWVYAVKFYATIIPFVRRAILGEIDKGRLGLSLGYNLAD